MRYLLQKLETWSPSGSHGAMPGGRHRGAGWRASKMGSLSETGGKR